MLYSYDKTTDQLVPAGDLGGGGLVGLKSTRTTTGDWTITGLTVGKPLYIIFVNSTNTSYGGAYVELTSGAAHQLQYDNAYFLGRQDASSVVFRAGNVCVFVPGQTTVTVKVSFTASAGGTILAYQ